MIFFITDCVICLTETREKSLSKCKCKYNIHKKCYTKFLENSMFSCPICRKPKKKIIKKSSNDIDFIIKLFFTIYFILIIIIYSLLLYINFTVFDKFIIKNFFSS
jgi:hypothetical protein